MENKEQELTQAKSDYDLANDIAKEKGFNSITDLMNTANEKMKSTNFAVQQQGRALASGLVKDLTLLMLYQALEPRTNYGYIERVANMFDDGYIADGNAKQYINSNDTGVDTWEPNTFVPSALTTTNVDEYIIQMYNKGGTLNSSQAYQFKKSKVIQEPDWLPYFKAGNLATFIAQLRGEIMRIYNLYKFDKIAKKITTSNPQTVVNGTATNMFDAFTLEILPLLRELTTATNKYNYAKTTRVNVLDANDIVIFMNAKTIQALQSGIKSQLFNAKLLDFKNVIDESNLINLGNQLTIGDGNTAIAVTETPYVDENTIYILDKTAIRHLLQINRSESQSWANNMTIEFVLHVWGALDILPWKVFTKYTNTNLSKLPN